MRPYGNYCEGAMIDRVVAFRSFRLVAISSGATWLATLLWPDLAPAVKAISEGLFWSVAFVLATSLATFNNTLRIFDRIEDIVKHDLSGLPPNQLDYLSGTIEKTEALTASLLVNSLIVILAGILYFVIGAFLSVPLPRWLPDWIQMARPGLLGIAIRFGLGVLATRILVIQFQAIPPMVAFYKFFTVDRHLAHSGLGRKGSDQQEVSDDSSSRSRM